MIHIWRGLAGLALLAPTIADARQPAPPSARPASVGAAAILPSEAAARVIDWVAAASDNHALPWAVVDKTNAALFLFDPKDKPLAAVPVLVGIAVGDDVFPPLRVRPAKTRGTAL